MHRPQLTWIVISINAFNLNCLDDEWIVVLDPTDVASEHVVGQ